jgi:glutathione synthase/RimK-type ligase-like ATP-grasp enzyme
MSSGEIVIVTCAADPHADAMMDKLHAMGVQPVRLDTDDIPTRATFSLTLEKGSPTWRGGISLTATGRTLRLDGVRSVWWRRPAPYYGLPPDLADDEREFAKAEIDHAFRGALELLDCYWVSHPDRIRRASLKVEQLQRAAGYGFDVPPTLVTTDPADVREFFAAHDGDIIYKVLTDPFLGAPMVAAKHPDRPVTAPRQTTTTRFRAADLNRLDAVRLAPCLFQAYVPKRVELRVTVIGDELFTVEIDSQAHPGTSLDWRNWDGGGFEIPYRAVQLPPALAEQCLRYVRSYGLNFSAIDLVLTPDGRYVFLENNPNGQFMWIEKFVPELTMTDALAACLLRGGSA